MSASSRSPASHTAAWPQHPKRGEAIITISGDRSAHYRWPVLVVLSESGFPAAERDIGWAPTSGSGILAFGISALPPFVGVRRTSSSKTAFLDVTFVRAGLVFHDRSGACAVTVTKASTTYVSGLVTCAQVLIPTLSRGTNPTPVSVSLNLSAQFWASS